LSAFCQYTMWMTFWFLEQTVCYERGLLGRRLNGFGCAPVNGSVTGHVEDPVYSVARGVNLRK
jgi:hypothetical protein